MTFLVVGFFVVVILLLFCCCCFLFFVFCRCLFVFTEGCVSDVGVWIVVIYGIGGGWHETKFL